MAKKKKKSNQSRGKSKNQVMRAISKVGSRLGIRMVLYALIFLIFISASTLAYQFGYRIFTTKTLEESPGTDILVTITQGMSDREVANLLEKKGLIEDSSVFTVQLKLYRESSDSIQPGTYTLNTSQTVDEIIAIITEEPEEEEETTALSPGITQAEEETGEDKS